MTLDSDIDIIEEYCSTGSDRAATAFVRKHQKFVFATAIRYLNNNEDADDAAQEVFIKALNNLNKFRADSSLKTWLYRITVNVSSNILRKRKIRALLFVGDRDDLFSVPSENHNPLQKLESSEFEHSFFKALALLPKKQRETFALRYFEDLKYDEISKMLGTSVGGLKANYYQAVKKLAKYLKNEKVK